MKYNCLDFAILRAVSENAHTEEELIYKTSSIFPVLPSYELYNSSLSSLISGGYIRYNGEKLFLTDKSKSLFKKKSLFESKNAMLSRVEDELLATEQTCDSDIHFNLSKNAYKLSFSRLCDECSFDAIFKIDVSDSKTSIIFSSLNDVGDDEEISKLGTLSLPIELNPNIAEHIFESASALAYPSKAKKVCISDGSASYVMTMAQDSGKIKISVQKILFNAKRFSGKRDSQLDYAQCADTCISFYTTQNILYMSAALLLFECECRKQGQNDN